MFGYDKIMGRKVVVISEEKLKELYIDQQLTSYEIGEKFGCSDATIRNKLREVGIALRTGGRKRFKYKKKQFDGSDEVKAYMFGFRIGDLNVYSPNKNSRIVVARCHTTIRNQVRVIQKLFGKYGMVKISETKTGSYHANCYLDKSFDFLMNKSVIPAWILKGNKNVKWAFIAGYVDAEGSFKLNQGRGRFKMDTYDHFVLSWVDKFLQKEQISGKLRQLCEAGELKYASYKWKNDLWRLDVNAADDLERFIQGMMPYLLHKDRIKDVNIVLENINERRKRGTIK